MSEIKDIPLTEDSVKKVLKPKRSDKSASSSTRFHSLVTYLSEKQLRQVLEKHFSSIRAYAYILHDQDDAEPHFQVLIRTYCPWYGGQLKKWFDGFYDDKDMLINTFYEPAHDMGNLVEYLTHTDAKSIADGKHQYDKSAIVDGGIFDLALRTDSKDSSYEVVNRLICGTPLRQMVRLFGRDFVYHFTSYDIIADLIIREEGQVNSSYKSREVLQNRVVPTRKVKFEEVDPQINIEEVFNK